MQHWMRWCMQHHLSNDDDNLDDVTNIPKRYVTQTSRSQPEVLPVRRRLTRQNSFDKSSSTSIDKFVTNSDKSPNSRNLRAPTLQVVCQKVASHSFDQASSGSTSAAGWRQGGGEFFNRSLPDSFDLPSTSTGIYHGADMFTMSSQTVELPAIKECISP